MTAPATPPPPSPLATPLPWNLVSTDYAAEVMPEFAPFAARALELAALPAGADIVDVACGPGTLAVAAAPAVNRVAALDFSPDMIALLRSHVAYGQLGNIDATVGDGQALPYRDDEFDAGFSMFGLIFFPDRHCGLRELRRVVKPGGRVVVASWLPFDAVPVMRTLFAALAEAMPELPFGRSPAPLGDEAAIRAEVGAAGFAAVEVHRASASSQWPSTEAMWSTFERTMAPLVLLRSRLGAAAWAPIAAQVRAVLAERLGPGPQTGAMEAWLTVATV